MYVCLYFSIPACCRLICVSSRFRQESHVFIELLANNVLLGFSPFNFFDNLYQIDKCRGTTVLMSIPGTEYIGHKCSQWLFFGRNIGLLTPKIIYFHYLIKYCLDQSIQKNILFNFEKRCTECSYVVAVLRSKLDRWSNS